MIPILFKIYVNNMYLYVFLCTFTCGLKRPQMFTVGDGITT